MTWRIIKTVVLCFITVVELKGTDMGFTLRSPAFEHNGFIPEVFTCDGGDRSPALHWQDIPAGTKSLALIMDDPDAPMGTWDHWILFNIPPNTTGLLEGVSKLPAGVQEGTNSWNKTGYGGPCPPDKEHRYFFKLYALDIMLKLVDGVTKQELEQTMEGHIIGETELLGRYNRPQNQ
ncbi:MAG: YbhB/YbcL family Raf kinase inhibitor-like protein [Pseudomonadota bacterium]